VMEAVRFDDHLKARSLRRQMDTVEAAGSTAVWLAWWEPKLNHAAIGADWGDNAPAGPGNSFQRGFTAGGVNPDALEFLDLPLGPQSGFDTFDIESAYLAAARTAGLSELPLAVLLALMEREGIKQFGRINRGVRNTTDETRTLTWEAKKRADDALQPAFNPISPATPPTNPAERSRRFWTLFPYGLDRFAQPETAAGVDALVSQFQQAGVTSLAGESLADYVHERVHSSFFNTVAGPRGTPRIWKRSRRAHWAFISLMAGFFRQLEAQVTSDPIHPSFLSATPAGWTPQTGANGWFPPGKSPPDLAGKTPVDPEWKDFISYYATIYVAYNGGAGTWGSRARQVELASGGSPLSLRDQMLFLHGRGTQIMAHVGRLAIGIDAYLRLDYMTQKFPGGYAAAAANTADPAGRAWGV
jgi:hypothetical protein